MTRDPNPLTGAFTPPEPSPGLRERSLTAARESMGRTGAPDIWTRIWGNRGVRLAWAASVGCLLFGHVVMNDHVRTEPASHAMPLAAVVEADDELTDVADLPRMTADLPGFEVAELRVISTTDEHTMDEETS